MDQLRVTIYKEVLEDVPAHFKRGRQIYSRKNGRNMCSRKISVEELIYLILFSVLWYVASLVCNKGIYKAEKASIANIFLKCLDLKCLDLRVKLTFLTKMFS